MATMTATTGKVSEASRAVLHADTETAHAANRFSAAGTRLAYADSAKTESYRQIQLGHTRGDLQAARAHLLTALAELDALIPLL